MIDCSSTSSLAVIHGSASGREERARIDRRRSRFTLHTPIWTQRTRRYPALLLGVGAAANIRSWCTTYCGRRVVVAFVVAVLMFLTRVIVVIVVVQ